jgi:hypothetical protein
LSRKLKETLVLSYCPGSWWKIWYWSTVSEVEGNFVTELLSRKWKETGIELLFRKLNETCIELLSRKLKETGIDSGSWRKLCYWAIVPDVEGNFGIELLSKKFMESLVWPPSRLLLWDLRKTTLNLGLVGVLTGIRTRTLSCFVFFSIPSRQIPGCTA